MMSLFSTFDMTSYTYFFLFMCMLIFNWNVKMFKGMKLEMIKNKVNTFLSKFFFSLKMKNFHKSIMSILMSMFSLIFLMNLSSLNSYMFPITSQLSLIFYVSLSIWLSINIMSMAKNIKNFISHLTPSGAPMTLIPFLFLIEIVSNLIRPLTVSVRMVANMLAGHLIVSLMYKMVLVNKMFMLTYTMLNLAEIGVALIQSYIFCTMICLYYSEMN